MIHFIVAIQQAIHTQKKQQQQPGDKRKNSSHQSGKQAQRVSAPTTKQQAKAAVPRVPFWKRWFTSGK